MATQRIHGIVLGPDRADIVSLEAEQEAWTPVSSVSIALEAGEEETEDSDLLADALRAHPGVVKGDCAVSVEASTCLLRVVELPSDDPDELRDMVDLQLDKFSPFPIDQLDVSYEVLARRAQQTRVLIAAAQRTAIARIGDAFLGVGGFAHAIDVDAVCRWRQIEAGPDAPGPGRCAVLVVESGGANLIICDDGIPTLVRALGGPGDMDRPAYCEMLAEETEYALTSMEAEWGGTPDTRFAIWHADPHPDDLVDVLGGHGGPAASCHPLKDLPPLAETVARRAVDPPPGRLNLAPPEWEEKERAAQTRRRLALATGGLLLAWLLVVAVFLGLLSRERTRLARAQDRLAALETPAAEVREIRDKAQFLENYIDQTYSSLEVLRELSVLMPQGLELNGMSFSRGGTISIRGSADTRSPIYTFQNGLERSALLTDVKLGKVDVVKGKNVFRLTAAVRGADEP